MVKQPPLNANDSFESLAFFVEGHPVPQGSKRFVGRGRMIEANPRLRLWRAVVSDVARAAVGGRDPIEKGVPVRLVVRFLLPRPRTVKRVWPTVPADLDKLTRAVGDALTDAGVWVDDSQVVDLFASKRYADGVPGVEVRVERK